MLPKAFTVKNMSAIMYEQTHRFVYMEHPHLTSWQDVYTNKRKIIEDIIPTFGTWLWKRIWVAKDFVDRMDDIIYRLALGLAKKHNSMLLLLKEGDTLEL